MIKHTKGQNEAGKYTAFDVIQHITKGGTYAGSTKLKHNTTAMMYVRVDMQTNERYMVYVKNRRGDINKKLYIVKTDEGLDYNSKKYNELEKALQIQKDMDNFQETSDEALLDLLSKPEFNVDEKSIIEGTIGIESTQESLEFDSIEEENNVEEETIEG
jgi:hypothetical protein